MGRQSVFWLLCTLAAFAVQAAPDVKPLANVKPNPALSRSLLQLERLLLALTFEDLSIQQAGLMGSLTGQETAPYDPLLSIDGRAGAAAGAAGGAAAGKPKKQKFSARYSQEFEDDDGDDGDEFLLQDIVYDDVELPKERACKEVECPTFDCQSTDADTKKAMSSIPIFPASDYRTYGGKQYVVSSIEMTYDQAGLACCKQNMTLVSVESGEEYAAMLELYKKEQKGALFWSSGQYLQCPNSYRWCGSMQRFQGQAVWKKGDIDAPGECVGFQFMDGGAALSFVDTICDNKMKFICESETKDEAIVRQRELASFVPKCMKPNCPELPCNANAKKTPAAYETVCGKKYVHIKKEMNFVRAQMECCEMGMRLISLESREEQICVENAFSKKTKNNGQIWTSGTDLGCEGRYTWCGSGSHMKNTDLMDWMDGEPNNFNEDEDCLSIWSYNGKFKLNDELCVEEYEFICEEIETNAATLNKGGPDLFKKVTTRPPKTEIPAFNIDMIA